MATPSADRRRIRHRRRSLSLSLFLGFATLYLLTTDYGPRQSVDTFATYVPAWHFAKFGNFRLDAFAGVNPWIVQVGDHWFSNRFPGAILAQVPLYWITGAPESSWPAAVTSALLAATLITALFALLRSLVPERTALALSIVVGLGTSFWSVTADAAWSTGPAVLCLMLGLLAIVRGRYLIAGLAFGAGLFARPYVALAALGIGLAESWIRRNPRCALWIGAGCAPGLAALLAYNKMLFGRFTIAGGYAAYATDARGTAGRSISRAVGTRHEGVLPAVLDASRSFLEAVAGSLISPQRGMLVFSPVVLVLVVMLVPAWRSAPTWVRSASMGGLLSLFGQVWINGFTGGTFYYGYRLPLIALACFLPLFALACQAAILRPRKARTVFLALVASSVFIQALGALPGYEPSDAIAPWTHSDFVRLLHLRPLPVILLCAAIAIAATAWCAIVLPAPQAAKTPEARPPTDHSLHRQPGKRGTSRLIRPLDPKLTPP